MIYKRIRISCRPNRSMIMEGIHKSVFSLKVFVIKQCITLDLGTFRVPPVPGVGTEWKYTGMYHDQDIPAKNMRLILSIYSI